MAVTNLNEGNIPQQPVKASSSVRTSFGDNTFFRVSKNSGSEYTTKLKETLGADFLVGYPEIKRDIIVLDKEVYKEIKFSCLVLTAEIAGEPALGKVFHVLLLAATGEVKNEYKNMGNKTVEIQLFPGDGLDAYLTNFVTSEIQKSFDGHVYNADGQVIPADFDISSKDMIHSLSVNCLRSLLAELNTIQPDYRIMNLNTINKDANLVIDISTGDGRVIDAVGHPVHSSFKIDFSAVNKQAAGSAGSIHSEQNQKQGITSMYGFLDLVFSPKDMSILLNNPFVQSTPQANRSLQRYAPRVIMTMFDSDTILLSHVLLGIYSTLALQHNKNWVQLFKRKVQTGRTPIYDDIGYLNIEANMGGDANKFGTNIDTSDFDLATLNQFVNTLIQDNLVVSMDCPDATSETYYSRVFQSAAKGNSSAHEVIYEYANEMTNGYLSKYIPKTHPIVNSDCSKILLGHWLDQDGITRDIRELTTVMVANMVGAANPEVIVDWFNLSIPGFFNNEDERLEKMKSTINFILDGAATFDGTAVRVNFNSEFLMAFMNAVSECGIIVNSIVTPINVNEMSNRRSVFQADNAAFNGVTNIFRSAGFNNDSPTRNFGGRQNFRSF